MLRKKYPGTIARDRAVAREVQASGSVRSSHCPRRYVYHGELVPHRSGRKELISVIGSKYERNLPPPILDRKWWHFDARSSLSTGKDIIWKASTNLTN